MPTDALARTGPSEPLLRVEEARRLLAACVRVDEAKDIRDKAEAIRAYLRQQGASREAQNDAAEIKLRAERRLGELLAEQRADGERRSAKDGLSRKVSHDGTPSSNLADLGITRNASSRWQEAARVPEERFEAFVAERRAAPQGEITSAGLRDLWHHEERRRERRERDGSLDAAPVPAPTGTYEIIYADPPWRYEHAVSASREIENQYPTMDLDAIKALAVPAAEDCVLLLWATSPKLAEAMDVISAWGFTYRTSLVWVKDRQGMGYWARQRHELLLVATRGRPETPLPENRPDSVISGRRGRHSAKPDEARVVIERMFPGRSKIELFARQRCDGWAAWGSEAPRGDDE